MEKKEFEKDLLSQNVTEKYLNMSREELEERFGSEFLKTVDFGSQNNNNHQYELFEHILRTVDNVDINKLAEKDALKVKIAAFFHDIGKPDVAALNEKTGQTQFIGHAKQSADIAKEILSNIGYNEQEIAELSFLIQSHDDFIPIGKKEDITEERISKVLVSAMKKTENYEPTISDFKNLIALCKADAMAQSKVIEKNGEIVDTQEDRLSRLDAIEEILPKAIILKQETEIEKLEKQKKDLQDGPIPIEKNGKIVNQKQIDMWNSMSNEEKEDKIENINTQINILKEEENKLLDKDKQEIKQDKFEIVPIEINTDAHNHTRGSDGRQTSFRAMLRAYNSGYNVMSVTDHDSVKGFRNLEKDIYAVMGTIREDKSYDPSKILEMFENIKILKGTELITSYKGVAGVEILGYNYELEKMEEEIAHLKTTVKEKPYEALYKGFNKIIDEKGLAFDKNVLDQAYEKIKIEGKGGVVGPFFEELYAHEENRSLLRYVDENGEEKEADTLKLFINKHLYNKESELFVDMSSTRPTFKDTIDAIHRAGGQAFLAHAGRYKDKMPVEEYIDDMINEGLDGLEVFYPDHSYEFREYLLEKVREHGIKASGGSDDHHALKEGEQYQTGRVAVPDIPETKWIKETSQNGKDFLAEAKFIQEAINELRTLKELRKQQIQENGKTNDAKEKIR